MSTYRHSKKNNSEPELDPILPGIDFMKNSVRSSTTEGWFKGRCGNVALCGQEDKVEPETLLKNAMKFGVTTESRKFILTCCKNSSKTGIAYEHSSPRSAQRNGCTSVIYEGAQTYRYGHRGIALYMTWEGKVLKQ